MPLYHPRQQRWRDHFAWNEDFTLIIGLTPTGRATVEALRLNREGVVNLRQILYAMGEHPPEETDQYYNVTQLQQHQTSEVLEAASDTLSGLFRGTFCTA